MMIQEPINVVYACNDDYALFAAVSIKSLLKHTKEEVIVHLLVDEVSNEKIELFKKINKSINIYNLQNLDDYIGQNYKDINNHKLTYSRLFLDRILNIQTRVIWIDADTIIHSSIKELYYENIEENICGMVPDCSDFYKKYNLFDDEDTYYNAGVILIDLKKWRELRIHEKIVEEMKRRKGKSIDYDQSYVNCVLKGKIKTLDKKYNCLIQYFETTPNPIIYHYAGEIYKPCYNNTQMNRLVKSEWDSIIDELNIKDYHFSKDEPYNFAEKLKVKIDLINYRIFLLLPTWIKRIVIRIRYGFTIKQK